MLEEENQISLFELPGAATDPVIQQLLQTPSSPVTAPAPAPRKPAAQPASKASPAPVAKATPAAKPAPKKANASAQVTAPSAKKVSGLVPEGDVRLTANIRQDLHLKLKIASAHRRTTIGEILEELIENHI